MDVLILVQMRELFVRLVRERQPAPAAARVTTVEFYLVSLPAETATD
jgi:hypothetical protein